MVATKFIHIADLHLGKRQYNNEERYKDFFRAFQAVLNIALREEVDFILIAGDMFDNRKLSPKLITSLFYMITNFKEKSIETLKRPINIICIEGNHDANLFSKQSWMSFLADLDLIILLSGIHNKTDNTVHFEPYNHETHRGGMIQIKNIKIYGFPYFGNSITRLFQPINETIKKDDKVGNILMLHLGIAGQDPSQPGIEITENLSKLHETIDYLALGHFHKKYQLPNDTPWIHNPGSLEITDIKEVINEYERCAFLVEVLETSSKLDFRTKAIQCTSMADDNQIPNRSFQHLSTVSIEGSSSFKESIEKVLSYVESLSYPLRNSDLAYNPSDPRCPVLSLNLIGDISYSRLDVNIRQLRELVLEKFSLLEVRIYSRYLASTLDEIVDMKGARTFQEIENEVFLALAKSNPRYESKINEIVMLMSTLKSEILIPRPNYLALKDMIKEWCSEHSTIFDTPIILKRPVEEPTKVEKLDDEDEYDDEDFDEEIYDTFILDSDKKSMEDD